jgi:hypothetical protein
MVKPDRIQTIYGACALHAGWLKLQTHPPIRNIYCLFTVIVIKPQYYSYIVRTRPVLFIFIINSVSEGGMAAYSLYSPSQVWLIRCLSFGFTAALFRKFNTIAIHRNFHCTAVHCIFCASTYFTVPCSVRLFMKFFPGSNSAQNAVCHLRFTRPVPKHFLEICHVDCSLTPHGCLCVLSFKDREEAMYLGITFYECVCVFPISTFQTTDHFYEIWGKKQCTLASQYLWVRVYISPFQLLKQLTIFTKFGANGTPLKDDTKPWLPVP